MCHFIMVSLHYISVTKPHALLDACWHQWNTHSHCLWPHLGCGFMWDLHATIQIGQNDVFNWFISVTFIYYSKSGTGSYLRGALVMPLGLYKIQNTNTHNFVLHRIKTNKTLATSHFSMVKIYDIILFTIKINLKHYTYYIDILDHSMRLTLF